jgi:hypothetical protein
MTPFQNIWVLLCTVGPAIYVGFAVNWWAGVIAYITAILLGGILGLGLVSVVPVRFMAASGYLKNLVVAVIIVVSGYYIGPASAF